VALQGGRESEEMLGGGGGMSARVQGLAFKDR
jgi:hypothetical protein